MYATQVSGDQGSGFDLAVRPWRCADDDAWNARDTGRSCQHVHHRRERSLAARHIEAHALDRRNLLARHDARGDLRKPLFVRHLSLMKYTYIARRLLYRTVYIFIQLIMSTLDYLTLNAKIVGRQLHTIEALHKFDQRLVASVAHGMNYRAHVLDQFVDAQFGTPQQSRSLHLIELG